MAMATTFKARRNAQNYMYRDLSPSQGAIDPQIFGREVDGMAGCERSTEGFRPRMSLPSNQDPTYFIGGSNGNALIEEVLDDLGWRKLTQKSDDGYTMKWCELKNTINYNTFKEGTQLVNHLPNCNLLTNKLGLLNSLQEYARACSVVKKRSPKLDFIPETFRLDDHREREIWKELWKEDEVWICKPTGRNQGKGIFLVKNREEFDQLCMDAEERNQQNQQGKAQKSMNRVIQRYLDKPLLLKNKKFDIRAYMLIANSTPFIVLYHKGYVRLSLFDYENKFDNLAVHLTNQFIQKKDPSYKDNKEETIWDMDRFNAYVNEHIAKSKGLPKDWVNTVLPGRMKNIMSYCFNAVKHKLHSKCGYFELYGFDFMVDEDMKVWLIEVNVNPTLATNCESLKSVIPPMVKETLYLAIECFDKSRKNRSLLPLQSLQKFELIHNGSASRPSRAGHTLSPDRADGTNSQYRSHSTSPVRRPRSLSPSKDSTQHLSSDNRRTFLSTRPGMKPSPTSPLLPAPRHSLNTALSNGNSASRGPPQGPATSTKGSMLTSQMAYRSSLQPSRNGQSQSQKSPSVLHKYNNLGARSLTVEKSQQQNKHTRTFNAKADVPTQNVTVQSMSDEPDSSQKKSTTEANVENSDTDNKPIKGILTELPPRKVADNETSPTLTETENSKEQCNESATTNSVTSSLPPSKSGTETKSSGTKGPYLKLLEKHSSKSVQGQPQKREVTNSTKSPYSKVLLSKPNPPGKTKTTKGSSGEKQTTKSNPKVENSSNNNNAVSVNILRDHKVRKSSQPGLTLKMTHGGEKKADLRGS